MSVFDKLIDNVGIYIHSPASIQRQAITALEEISNGDLTLPDTSNPFAALLGANAAMVSAAAARMEVAHRNQYERASTTMMELYSHISDRDISKIFSQPSRITIQLSLAMTELQAAMVRDPVLNIHKLVIPRNTTFTVADIQFSLQYPVEIRRMEHGGLTVVYDTSKQSPLKELSANAIPWGEFVYDNVNGRWLTMQLEVDQFAFISKTGSISPSQQFKLDIQFPDNYYTARVFVSDSSGEKELPVVLSNRVVDLATPCAVVEPYDGFVRVSLPQIFTQNGSISGTVRADVYYTKGDISINLSEYPITEFVAKWFAVSPSDNTVYSAPLNTFRSVACASSSITTGGRKPLTVDEIRERIFTNSIGKPQIPITPAQINQELVDAGYTIIKGIDVVTDRVFLATRELIAPSVSDYSTLLSSTITPRASSGIAANMSVVSTRLSTLVDKSGIIDNGYRVTITPEAFFVYDNGDYRHLTADELRHLKELSVEQKVVELSSKEYKYTPFHYVLDATTSDFDLRAYYLVDPVFNAKLFIAENASSLLQVGVQVADCVKTDYGYSLLIRTVSSETVRTGLNDSELICQLGIRPHNQRDRAYINAELIRVESDGERIFEFKLKTNFDIDRNHSMIFNDFYMYTEDPLNVALDLDAVFDIFFVTTAQVGPQYSYSNIDSVIGRAILPEVVYTVNHEQLDYTIGKPLDALWKRARSYVDEMAYKRHTVSIPKRYTENQYARDPETNQIFRIIDGEVVYNEILHRAGDPQMTEDGDVVYAHMAGDLVIENGQPVIESERAISRYIDILMLDGLYYFATDPAIQTYRKKAHDALASWIVSELSEIGMKTLDNTSVFFHPKVLIGLIEVIVDDSRRANIHAEQALVIDLYVTEAVNNNDALKNTLVNKASSVLKSELTKTQISISAIIEELRRVFGNDVIDVGVKGLGGTANYSAVTIINQHNRCSVRQKLIALADSTTTVVDDITFNWISHKS